LRSITSSAGSCTAGSEACSTPFHKAEDRGVGSKAEGQREDGDSGEADLAAHGAQRVAQISPEIADAGLRDKVIHDYFGVNLEIVWAVVDKEVPKLPVAISTLLLESRKAF
jgi:hypothetical protein